MIGDKINATYKDGVDIDNQNHSYTLPKNVEGTIIYESDDFITLRTKNYLTSINKIDIELGRVSLKRR